MHLTGGNADLWLCTTPYTRTGVWIIGVSNGLKVWDRDVGVGGLEIVVILRFYGRSGHAPSVIYLPTFSLDSFCCDPG